jgi:predicted ATPase
MRIHSLQIGGYKSIGKIRLENLNPFTVFVGANASGKSNILEALEFMNSCSLMDPDDAIKDFGGINAVAPAFERDVLNGSIDFQINFGEITSALTLFRSKSNPDRTFDPIVNKHFDLFLRNSNEVNEPASPYGRTPDFKQLVNFTRLFIGQTNLVKRNILDDSRLQLDASNLEIVLKRILKDDKRKGEIIEILQALIPGFEHLKIISEDLSGTDNLLIYEKGPSRPFTKRLISDGTYNLIAIIASIFQSETPQFLCIEEPENGLNPKVARQLVSIFRSECEDKGHHIWLNTHSQSIISELTTEEVILVDKVDGLTMTKQVRGKNLHGLRMDEALLTNSLGGGIPW